MPRSTTKTALLEAIEEEDLFTRGRYTWTKNNTLGAYFVSSTSSHDLLGKNHDK